MPATRPSNNTAGLTNGADDPEDDYYSDDVQDAPPPRKRAKTKPANEVAAKPVKRRKGKLSKLPDMPLDVLFEIFGCLHPLDLLHIGHTTKLLRTVIMSRSARSVWRDAFASVDVPDCPEDLSEPEYANLMFDNLCHCCVKSRATQTFWTWRRRYCKKCLNEGDVVQQISERYGVGPTWQEIQKQMEPVSKLLPLASYTIGTGRNSLMFGYSISDLMRLEAAATRQLADGNDLKQLSKEFLADLDKKTQHGKLCHAWQRASIAEKDGAREGARERRRAIIMQKLQELGWEDELKGHPRHYQGLYQLSYVKQAKDLTERVWLKIEPSIVEFMEHAKATRLAENQANRSGTRYLDIQKLLLDFMRTMGPNDVVATTADICFVPEIREIVTNASDEVYEKFKSTLPAQLPDLSKNCIDQRNAYLAELIVAARQTEAAVTASEAAVSESAAEPMGDAMPSGSPKSSDPMCLLKLATSWFQCPMGYCGSLDYEQAHTHRCLFFMRGNDDTVTNAYIKQMGVQPWNLERTRIQFNVTAAAVAAELVQAYGKDPLVTTAEEMDLMNPRFAILQKDSVAVVTWRRIIKLKSERMSSSECAWRRLSDEELPDYTVFGAVPQSSNSYNCLHCFKSGGLLRGHSENVTFNTLQKHFTTDHQNITMMEADYYRSLSNVKADHLSGFTRAAV